MASRGKKGVVAAFVAWVIIVTGCVLIYRFIVDPFLQERRENEAAEALVAETSAKAKGDIEHEVVLYADGFSGYAILRSDEFREALAKEKIDLEIIDDHADYGARMQALISGDAQMAAFPLNSFLKAGAEVGQFPATIVLIIDETQGADAIVAYREGLSKIQDLDQPDARVFFTGESPSEFLAEITVESFVLPSLSPDWRVKRPGSEKILEDLLKGDPKEPFAYVMWEPQVSKALEDPDVHVLLDSSRTKGFILDALVVERNFLKENEQVVAIILESYLRTLFSSTTSGGMEEVVREDLLLGGGSLSDAYVRNIADGIVWKNTTDNFTYFGVREGEGESIDEILEKITDVMVDTGLLSEDPLDGSYNSIYYDAILAEMHRNGFHPGKGIRLIEGIDEDSVDELATGIVDMPELGERQWNSLRPVGNFQVEQIRFPRMSAKITLQNGRRLSEISQRLKDWPSYYVTLVGQSQETGDAALDQVALDLALRRARAAADFLIGEGTDPDRLRVVASLSSAKDWSSLNLVFEAGQLPY
ncbi:MAG: OmpA family protein [Verrucomicrobiota bacterium]